MVARMYQVVIYGATSFVGKLVCEHIARDYQGKIRWAMAARTQSKLDALKQDLAKINPACKDVATLIADSSDAASLDSLAAQTDVIITTAGPFAKIGLPVVEACAKKGTHYCDTTGEVQFVRASMTQFDERAKASGAKILHCCGYDSVPSDLATLETVSFALRKFGRPPDEVNLLQEGKGGLSGGTLDSMIQMLNEGPDTMAVLADPYCLDPPGSLHSGGKHNTTQTSSPLWCEAAKSWSGPFVMSVINEPVVRRTNALVGYAYGENFVYRERMPASSYPVAVAESAMNAAMNVTTFAAAKLPFVRKLLPAAGEGPSKQTQLSGWWKASSYGLIRASEHEPEKRILAVLEDRNRDPGYWSTSRIILEVALCLALEQSSLERDEFASKVAGGVLTPAAALGHVLTGRLLSAGYNLDVREL